LIWNFGFILFGSMLGIDSNILGYLGLGIGILGAMFGAGLWLLGANVSLLS
jgi:hypothetical protein